MCADDPPPPRSIGAGPRIVTVAKVIGGEWFDRMADGIAAFGAEHGTRSTMIGADDIDPDKQRRLIADLVAQRPDAITVVPNSPEALEGVLAEARSAGIIVITHESSAQVNVDADIEAFDNRAYGARMAETLAALMGGQGRYVAFLGQPNAPSHLEWIAGADAAAAALGLRPAATPIVSYEKAEIAYEATVRLLAERPDVTGFLGTGSTDVQGIGRAIREAGLQRRTAVVGTSIPSMAGDLLTDRAVDRIFFWDPALAGQAQHRLAQLLIEGHRPVPGMDLGIAGYRAIQRMPGSTTTFLGDAWVEVDATNAAEYRL